LNGNRSANRTGFRDVASESHEVRMRHNSVGNIDREVVGRIACASLRHEGEVPGTIVSRSRVCSTRQGNKKACCRCAKRKLFHVDFSAASQRCLVAMEMVKRLVRQKKNISSRRINTARGRRSRHHEFVTGSVSVLDPSTATPSRHLAQRRSVDRAESATARVHLRSAVFRPVCRRQHRRTPFAFDRQDRRHRRHIRLRCRCRN
jgi:hypothetical protein